MIGTLPVSKAAPLEYRWALDVAMVYIASNGPTAVVCNADALADEVRQRIPDWPRTPDAASGLWVEPMVDSWREDLRYLALALPAGAPLAVVYSQPLAALLPERRGWPGWPIGAYPLEMRGFRWELRQAGFRVGGHYGFHTPGAILRSLLGNCCDRLGLPHQGDRLRAGARLGYYSTGALAELATVGLIIAWKDR